MTCEEKILSEDYVDLIEDIGISYGLEQVFTEYCVQDLGAAATLLYVPADELGRSFPSREMFSVLPRCYALTGETQGGVTVPSQYDVLALGRCGITQVQKPPLSLTGRGTVLALIGPGIDYRSPLFRRADGSSRILAIWDQTLAGGKKPEGLSYGTEFTREDIDAALQTENPLQMLPLTDASGYGNILAALAAGQLTGGEEIAELAELQSPAPEAEFVVVRVKEAKAYLKDLYCIFEGKAYQENDIMAALWYVRRFVSVGRRGVTAFCPLGTSMGNHGGSGHLDRFLDEILSARNFSAVWCGGDEGNERRHFEGSFETGESQEQEVELSASDGCDGFMLQFWAEKPAVFQLSVQTPAGETTGWIGGGDMPFRRYEFVYGSGYLTVSYLQAEDASGWQCALLRFVSPLAGIWKIRVKNTETGFPAKYHMWLPLASFLRDEVFFPVSSPYVTLVSPVSGRGLLTVGSVNLRSGSAPVWCSRGFSSGGEVLPDMAAPGEDCMTIAGTLSTSALSAAYVAGASCQMMQWGITDGNDTLLGGDEISQYFLRGAERKTDLTYPSRELGYGQLNLYQTFRALAGITG